MLQAKEDALQQELHTTRIALLHQVCHHCSHTNAERPDDVVSDVATNRLYSLSLSFMLLIFVRLDCLMPNLRQNLPVISVTADPSSVLLHN
jgi:hypothetical protein